MAVENGKLVFRVSIMVASTDVRGMSGVTR